MGEALWTFRRLIEQDAVLRKAVVGLSIGLLIVFAGVTFCLAKLLLPG